jgi:hypothetical protein
MKGGWTHEGGGGGHMKGGWTHEGGMNGHMKGGWTLEGGGDIILCWYACALLKRKKRSSLHAFATFKHHSVLLMLHAQPVCRSRSTISAAPAAGLHCGTGGVVCCASWVCGALR